MEAGRFRGEGQVHGGGGSAYLGTDLEHFQATVAEDHGETLRSEFTSAVAYLNEHVSTPVENALAYFCMGAYRQFNFDGNKRTSRLMMNGILLASGYAAISVPFSREKGYNNHLHTLSLTRTRPL